MSDTKYTTQFSQEELNNEEWRSVVGWEGIYSVSNLGRVKTLKQRPKIIKPEILIDGYSRVAFYSKNTRIRKLVHNIVAEAFIGIKPEGFQCNHKDGIKTNNRPFNLEYITQLENMRHAYRNGLMAVGDKSGAKIRAANRQYCKNGHERISENYVPWILEKYGWRVCRLCKNIYSSQRKARIRQRKLTAH